MKKKLKKVWVGFLIGTVASIFISVFTAKFFEDLFDKFEHFTYDMRYKWQYDPQMNPSDTLINWQPIEDVVVCDIDERAMSKYGVYWKWPRSYHGDVVRELGKDGAAIIGFDILFGKADFGKGRTEEIEQIAKNIGVPVGKSRSERIRSQVNYDQMFCDAVAGAGRVVAAMQMNDSNEYQFAADWIEKSTEEWRLSTNPSSGAKLADSISRMFQVEHPAAGGKTVLREKDALEGIFPELAQAAQRIGFVNVVPDADGIHRAIPLFYNFRGYTYPALSLQMAMQIMGVGMKDLDIKLGEYVNLGKPFKIWRDTGGSLQSSYPGITGIMVERLVALGDSIKALPERGRIQISAFVKMKKDKQGKLWVEVADGDIPQAIVRDLYGITPAMLAQIGFDEPMQVGMSTALTRYDDGTFDIIQMNSAGEAVNSWEGNYDFLLELLQSVPIQQIQQLKRGASMQVATDLSVWRDAKGSFDTECPVLHKKAVDDLIRLKVSDLKELQPKIKLGVGKEAKIPIDKHGHHIITFRGPARRAFKYVSYYDVKEKRIAPHYFQHKTVILGSSAPALFDIVSSPFAARFPGVEIHATLLADFLDGTFLRKVDPTTGWIVLLLMGMVMGTVSYLLRPMWAGIVGATIIIGHFLVAMTLFDGHVWIEIIRPIMTVMLSYIAVVAYQYVTEEKDKKFLHETFKLYLSPDVIEEMYDSKQKPNMGGEEGVRTAYFTDIQGFSTFSEKLGSPVRLVELLNEYLTGMTDILLEQQGTLDKYEGDAIIAFFGAPMPLPDHATRACATAVKMQLKLAELRRKWASEGDKWPKIVHEMRMRVGVNSGQIVTGNMGSNVRMNFTMMGDAVNLAARLESGAKPYGAFALCSADTLKMTDGSLATRQLDILRVMGKSEPVAIHEIICFKDSLDDKKAKAIETFSKAYEAYCGTRWDDAIALFEESLKHEPWYGQPGVKTCPSIALKERCLEYRTTPPVKPGETWDGVYTATSK